MEQQLYKQVYQLIRQIVKNKTIKRAKFNDAQILSTYFWAVLHDSNRLYDIASERSVQLVARPRIKGKALGHRRQSPYRLISRELLKQPFGQSLIRDRTSIERMFGNLTTFAGGLKPLPHWVRTLPRVRLWVQAKMVLFHLWRSNRHAPKTA